MLYLGVLLSILALIIAVITLLKSISIENDLRRIDKEIKKPRFW